MLNSTADLAGRKDKIVSRAEIGQGMTKPGMSVCCSFHEYVFDHLLHSSFRIWLWGL